MKGPKAALVTGTAGFIGSHLAERLLVEGWQVTGVDCFTDYYSRSDKEQNLATLIGRPGFTFVEADLVSVDLRPLLAGEALATPAGSGQGQRPASLCLCVIGLYLWRCQGPTYH
jgi:nucleoside-diphosphate-sugar epimerase